MTQRKIFSLAELRHQLDAASVSSTELLEGCLKRIAAAPVQSARTFTRIYEEQARAAASAQDQLLRARLRGSPLAGIPLSIKDLFDVEGEETLCAASLSSPHGRADRDALAIARLRHAGAVVLGRTNMSPYAFSGVGTNQYHGTPSNPHGNSRAPGGSSSGAAVSVAEGMAAAALGSDTAGSVRIPAALCGLAGFKPTRRRIPLEGVRPLSWTLDSIGPLGVNVDCCHTLDAVMAGEQARRLNPVCLDELRLVVPDSIVLEYLDPPVAKAFDRTLTELSARGAQITTRAFPEIAEMFELGGVSRIIGAEAYSAHRGQMESILRETEAVISERIAAGAEISAADYIDVLRERSALINSAAERLSQIDAIVMPTVPLLAPKLASLENEADFYRVNRMLIRNTSVANFLDLCSVTLPISERGALPVGCMLMAAGGRDHHLLAIAKGIEGALPVR